MFANEAARPISPAQVSRAMHFSVYGASSLVTLANDSLTTGTVRDFIGPHDLAESALAQTRARMTESA